MGKKVLILGNGFDLAHGLPTQYKDFLRFCEFSIMVNDKEKCAMEKYDIKGFFINLFCLL